MIEIAHGLMIKYGEIIKETNFNDIRQRANKEFE